MMGGMGGIWLLRGTETPQPVLGLVGCVEVYIRETKGPWHVGARYALRSLSQ